MSTVFTVTDGKTHYSGLKHWAKVPDGVDFQRISQIAVDAEGRVYAVQRVAPAVLVFAPDGTLEHSWHHEKLPNVHGVAVSPDGHVFITSFDGHQVLKFTRRGDLVLEIGEFNNPTWQEPFNHPTDVAVAADGEIYVTDGYANARVHRFSADGKLIQSWGEQGTGPGQFNVPHALWITTDNRVVVLDRDNDRIQVFSRDGELLDIWTGFTRPMDIWGNAEDELFVSDQTPRILRLSPQGKVVGIFRNLAPSPHGLYGDRTGNLFVADLNPNSVTKYARR